MTDIINKTLPAFLLYNLLHHEWILHLIGRQVISYTERNQNLLIQRVLNSLCFCLTLYAFLFLEAEPRVAVVWMEKYSFNLFRCLNCESGPKAGNVPAWWIQYVPQIHVIICKERFPCMYWSWFCFKLPLQIHIERNAKKFLESCRKEENDIKWVVSQSGMDVPWGSVGKNRV